MNINRIDAGNLNILPGQTGRTFTVQAGFNISDGFARSSTGEVTQNQILNKFTEAQNLEATKEIEKVQEEKAAPERTGRIFRITEDGVYPLTHQEDGSILVDAETGTSVFTGKAARNLLENTTEFHGETEIILPPDCRVELKIGRKSIEMAEAGAFLIGDNTGANVKVIKGEPVVIQTQRAPGWYERIGPDGPMKDQFDKMSDLNRHLVACSTSKDKFSPEDLQKLQEFNLVTTDPSDQGSVFWDPSVKSDEDLNTRLIQAGFQGEAIKNNTELWLNTVKRRILSFHYGRVPRKAFTREQLKKLVDCSILLENKLDRKMVYWSKYTTEGELREILTLANFHGDEADGITNIWKKTTRSGYDHSGLAWDSKKVVAYSQKDKFNMWNANPTEWLVNSTAYAGKNKPFTVGVSTVRAKKVYDQPVDFHQIRPGETIHRHPVREDKKQTEGYMVRGGKAALLTIRQGKPAYTFMEPGDMAVIDPGVAHCVLAAEGDYDHLCFQVPSAFQYGFLFKNELKYEDFAIDHKTLVDGAIKGLKEGKHGTFGVSE